MKRLIITFDNASFHKEFDYWEAKASEQGDKEKEVRSTRILEGDLSWTVHPLLCILLGEKPIPSINREHIHAGYHGALKSERPESSIFRDYIIADKTTRSNIDLLCAGASVVIDAPIASCPSEKEWAPRYYNEHSMFMRRHLLSTAPAKSPQMSSRSMGWLEEELAPLRAVTGLGNRETHLQCLKVINKHSFPRDVIRYTEDVICAFTSVSTSNPKDVKLVERLLSAAQSLADRVESLPFGSQEIAETLTCLVAAARRGLVGDIAIDVASDKRKLNTTPFERIEGYSQNDDSYLSTITQEESDLYAEVTKHPRYTTGSGDKRQVMSYLTFDFGGIVTRPWCRYDIDPIRPTSEQKKHEHGKPRPFVTLSGRIEIDFPDEIEEFVANRLSAGIRMAKYGKDGIAKVQWQPGSEFINA